MVERTKEEVSIGLAELANRVEWAHLGVASAGLGAMLSGSGTKRPG
jgi:hypothetical protein